MEISRIDINEKPLEKTQGGAAPHYHRQASDCQIVTSYSQHSRARYQPTQTNNIVIVSIVEETFNHPQGLRVKIKKYSNLCLESGGEVGMKITFYFVDCDGRRRRRSRSIL